MPVEIVALLHAYSGAVDGDRGVRGWYEASERRRGMLLEEMRPHVEALEALEGRFPLPDGGAAELAETVRAQRAAVGNLSVEVDDAERELSSLEALISDVPAELRPKIARLPDPKYNLAAHGVAFAFAILIEAPVIMLMSASTALVEDAGSYRKLRNFANTLNIGSTLMLLVALIPPVFDFVMRTQGIDFSLSEFCRETIHCISIAVTGF